MSEKSKKPKDADIGDIPEEEIVNDAEVKEDKSKDKKSGSILAKANSMANRKKSMDPIIAISAAIFLLACVVVIGNFAYDKTLADHTQPRVEYGDNIEVDYIGCYNNFYDGDNPKNGAVIFDTSMKNLNAEVPKSYEYNPAFKTLTFEAGKSDSLLMKFQQSVIGYRPGDTVTVMIPAADGYGELTPEQKLALGSDDSVTSTYTFATTADFKEVFGFNAPAYGDGVMYVPAKTSSDAEGNCSPYGFATYVVTNLDSTVTVSYSVEVGESYVVNEYLSLEISSAEDGIIEYYYIFNEDKIKADKATLIQAYIDNQPVYIVKGYYFEGEYFELDDDDVYYKTTDEKTGENLYFTIKILGYVSS